MKHWLAPRLLATKLARGEITNREVAQYMIVWSAFWALSWAWRKWMLSVASADGDFMQLLGYISGRMGWFLTMAAIVGCQIAFFVWMQRMMRKVHMERQGRDMPSDAGSQ